MKENKEHYKINACIHSSLEDLRRHLINENIYDPEEESISFFLKDQSRILPGFLREYTIEEAINDKNEISIR